MDIANVFTEFMDYQRDNGAQTQKFYRQCLTNFMRWLEINRRTTITPATVDQFINALRDGWHPASRLDAHRRSRGLHTLAKYRRAIRGFLYFSMDRGYMERFKVKIPKTPKIAVKFLNGSQFKVLWGVAKRTRDKLVLALLAETCARASEALNIEWRDVDRSNQTILIRSGKGDKDRIVSYGPVTAAMLEQVPNGSGPVIRSIHNEPLGYQGLRHVLIRLGRKAGIKVQAHDLRRTGATMLQKNGMPINYIKNQLGHEDLTTTQKYLGLDVDDFVAAYSKASPLTGLDLDIQDGI